jgi:ribosomal protein L37AE/L43A
MIYENKINADAHTENKYKCNHCGKIVKRKSEKRWIESYCDYMEKTTRLWRVNA